MPKKTKATPKTRAQYYAAQLQNLAKNVEGQASRVQVDYDRDYAEAYVVIRGANADEVADRMVDYVQPSKKYGTPWIQIGLTGQVTSQGVKHGKEVKRPADYRRGASKTIQGYPTRFPGLVTGQVNAMTKNAEAFIDFEEKNDVRIRLRWNEDGDRPEDMA